VGCQFWQRLGIDAILKAAGLSERARQLTCAMTLNRLIRPASELAMPEWIRSTALPDILGVDFQNLAEDALYRNLDKLHPRREAIEAALAERERNLFDLDQTVFLYDVTSTYFEGRALANRKPGGGTRATIAATANRCWWVWREPARLDDARRARPAFPLAHEVMALREGQTVVVDRGMSGEENLEKIRARGLHDLVAAPYSERQDWVGEFQDAAEFDEVRGSCRRVTHSSRTRRFG